MAAKLVFQSRSFRSDSKDSCIRKHYFNRSCEVFLPKLATLPTEITVEAPDNDVYYEANAPLSFFSNESFVESTIKRGQLHGISQNSHIDTGNVFCLVPTGKLILSVRSDLYHELGLVGKKSLYQKGRFVIQIDLLDSSFRSGTKYYKRVNWCLSEKLNLKAKFLLSWQQKGSDVGTEIVPALTDISHQEKRPLKSMHTFTNLCLPKISQSSPGLLCPSGEYCTAREFLDWLGTVACRIGSQSTLNERDSFVSTFCCPEPSQVVDVACSVRWTGLIVPSRIQRILDAVRNVVKRESLPWATVTVWGFADSPVGWNLREHGYHLHGDNNYTFVVFPDDTYWLLTTLGTHDMTF
ncbi:ribonuclease P protein subunit p40-like [Oscarella lobularis]|uniref:ribonuclease P protein subunit p40-like n=1 Tax=Oscarella lobularis TaxID=121494 RepID=UPI00331345CF